MIDNKHWTADNTFETAIRERLRMLFLFSVRNVGKSFGVKKKLLERWLEDNSREIMLLRRFDRDLVNDFAAGYFSDSALKEWLEKASKGKYNAVRTYRGQMIIEKQNADGTRENGKRLGFCYSVSQAERLKSNSIFQNVEDIVFEEFVATGMYLSKEVELLNSIISTVARDRDIRVWFIGNSIDRDCPYFREYQLTNIPRMKPGTFDIYNIKTGTFDDDGNEGELRIGVEFCERPTKSLSNMFAGSHASGITGSVWVCESKPHLNEDIDNFSKIYTVFFERGLLSYRADLLSSNKGDFFWYVSPKTKDFSPLYKFKPGDRVVSENASVDCFWTTRLIGLSEYENKIFDLMKNGKIFYSDNLTGTEFERALAAFL